MEPRHSIKPGRQSSLSRFFINRTVRTFLHSFSFMQTYFAKSLPNYSPVKSKLSTLSDSIALSSFSNFSGSLTFKNDLLILSLAMDVEGRTPLLKN